MNQHVIASVTTARADGQIADDALMIHRAAVAWGCDDLAADQLGKFLRSTGYLYDDAVAEAAKAGVELDLDQRPRAHCLEHLYYPAFHGGCPICL